MGRGIIFGLCFILVGISFLIMLVGFIKNKYIVYAGGLLFIASVILFLISFKEVLFT